MERFRILVIDDEFGMRKGAVRSLRDFQVSVPEFEAQIAFDTDEAEDGASALAILAESRFDIVLIDYKLPDMTGLDILCRIMDAKYDTLPIMITAYASLEVAVSATKNGAFDFLAKPFTPEELRCIVSKASSCLLLQREARRLAEEKRQVRFQFLSVLAHELKAPLNAIEGYLRIIDDRTAGDALANYDHMVKRSLARIEGMRKLIFDLLDLTRIESGQKRRELAATDIVALCKHSMESLSPDASAKRIAIKLSSPESFTIEADSGEIEIIFNNLISNAVKYNKPGGSVDISISKDGPTIAIKVSDTGIGMTPEELAKIFNDFVRIKNRDTKEVLGSGLGLSILKRLSSLYGGEVKVESERGKGSTFTVTMTDSPALPQPDQQH